MNRAEGGILDEPLADEDRVLIVVSAPRHIGAENIPAECEFAFIGRSPIGDNVAGCHFISDRDDGPLMDARAVVAPFEGVEFVPVVPHLTLVLFTDICVKCFIGMDDDIFGGDAFDGAAPLRDAQCPGVPRDACLHAGADERCFRRDKRHGLSLVVRAHERAVRVFML